MVLEDDNHCMSGMRKYANSVGIYISKPIEFSYSIGPDDSGMAYSVVQIRFHLKWEQQNRPFGTTSYAERSSNKAHMATFGTVVIFLIIFML